MGLVVSSARLISFPAHGAIEFLLGLALMAAPFAVGADPAGIVVGFGLGVLVTGVSLTSIGAGPRGTTTSVTAHQAYDQGLSLGGAGAALVLAIAGQGAVAVSILVIAAALFTLSMATRYSAR